MATAIQLISNGTTYHLHNSTGNAVAGSVLTTVTTTPVVVEWPLAWEAVPVNDTFGYQIPPVERTIRLRALGSSHDNLMTITQTLRRALNAASFTTPAYLSIQPDSSTSAVYYRVHGGDVQERQATDSVSDAPIEGSVSASLTLIIRCSALGARLTTPETLISAVSFGNAGTGTPDNIDAYTSGAGDLIYEGSPCNYLIQSTDNGSGDPIRQTILASITSRTYIAPAPGTWSTSGTTFATGANTTISSSLSLSGLADNPRLRMRVLAIVASGHTGSPEFQFRINTSSASSGVIRSSVIPAVNGDGQTTTRFLDSGPMPITFQALKSLSDYTVTLQLNVRSTDGGATTGTISSAEVLLYYDFCTIRTTGADYGSTSVSPFQVLSVSTFAEGSGKVLAPLPYPQAFVYRSTDSVLLDWGEIRGTVPRYYSGASLYVRLVDASGTTSGNCYVDTARTMTVTATHAPQYRTLRGGG